MNVGDQRRVLIVVSSYAPAMIADMHRARHLAWELPGLGWQVDILTPDSSYQQADCLDSDADAFFAPDTPTTFVPAFAAKLFRGLGVGSIGWRAIVPMWRAGRRLLKGRRFDVVYISTTQFPFFLLGPLWRREFSVPYVLDFHDPIYREAKKYRAWLRPKLKHRVVRWISHLIEACAVKSACGLVSVSPDYIEDLRLRYGTAKPAWMVPAVTQVIPFAVLPRDLETAAPRRDASAPGRPRIVYVGAGGAIMRRSFGLLCAALAHLRSKDGLSDRLSIELYGTLRGWREGGRKELAEVAQEHSVGDLVAERPGWISYRRSLELLMGGDGALILGVDDAGYMPSKLFTYLFSGKPVLASLRREGPAFAEFQKNPALGHALWFSETGTMPVEDAAAVLRSFLDEVGRRQTFDRSGAVRPFSAPTMAVRHAELLNAVCASRTDRQR